MFKILRRKSTQKFVVAELKNGKWIISQDYETKEEAIQRMKELKRNAYKREENQILKDICGTSARSARLDIGL
jgi:hypothetical protein